MPTSHVTAIILNYNTSNESIELDKNLKKLNYENIEVIVVDSASNDRDRKKLSNYFGNNQIIFNKKNAGYAAGNNIGIREAIDRGTDYIWILNPDIRVSKESLNILVQNIESDPELLCIGPRILYRNNPDKIFSDGGIIDIHRGFKTYHLNSFARKIPKEHHNKILHVDYVNGSVALFKADAFQKVGFLRECFFMYFEETEWCIRAKNLGYKLGISTLAEAYHKSSPKNRRYHFYMTRNRIWLAKILGTEIRKTLKYVFNEQVIENYKFRSEREITFINYVCGIIPGYIIGLTFKPYNQIFLLTLGMNGLKEITWNLAGNGD